MYFNELSTEIKAVVAPPVIGLQQSEPEVSIAISTFNHQPYIEQTILSALAQQTSFRFEIVIADDQSNDGTAAICFHYQSLYPSIIRVLDNSRKYGQSHNLERVIKNSKGRYIAYCEGDDYFTDLLKLQRQFEFMEENKDVAVCFHRIISVDQKGEILDQQETEAVPQFFDASQLIHRFVPTPSMFFKGNTIDFPPEFHEVKSTDAFLLALLANKGKGADLGFIGAAYRKHPGGLYNKMNKLERFEQTLHTRQKMKESKAFSPTLHKEIVKELHHREWVYFKSMLKGLQFKELAKLLLFITKYRLRFG